MIFILNGNILLITLIFMEWMNDNIYDYLGITNNAHYTSLEILMTMIITQPIEMTWKYLT